MSGMKYDREIDGRRNWVVEECGFDPDHLAKCESVFSLGNGYLGLRSGLEEGYIGEKRGLFVAGTFNKSEPEEAPELPNLPDLTNVEMHLNGCRFSMERGRVLAYERWLDLYTGELCRRVEWESPKNEVFILRFRRFVSQKEKHLFGMRIEVTPKTGEAEIRLRTGINGQMTNSGAQHLEKGSLRLYPEQILELCAPTGQSRVWCSLHGACRYLLGQKDLKPELLPVMERRAVYARAVLVCPAGETLALEKICCVHTGRDLDFAELQKDVEEKPCQEEVWEETLKEAGYRLLLEQAGKGYEALLAESSAVWADWWARNDVHIDTEEEYHQLAVRFALYHLRIMTSREDPRIGVAAKGLSGEGYLGHSFWDTEIFILPFFTYTCPKVARQLLLYRWYCLYGARRKARENGFQGAMYPWECAWITDGEATPLWGGADVITGKPMMVLTGLIEHHITADISYAVWQYYQVTGDRDFMDQFGYEILIDTARFWASRAQWEEERKAYVINDVIGPDEYKEHVDNNAYTNYMAHWNMRLGLLAMETLKQEGTATAKRLDQALDFEGSRKQIEEVLEKLYLPKPNADGILPQFDGYFDLRWIDLSPYKQASQVGTIYHDYNIEQISNMQVAKQADVLMLMLLLEDLFGGEVKRKNYDFYEERTLHDSSLSKNTHCVLACDLGARDQAERFFEGSCSIDLGQEMDSSDMGIHAAAMGGIWMSVVYGFGGVRLSHGQLRIEPKLHTKWKGLSFPLCWQGVPLRISIVPEGVTVENRGIGEVTVRVFGETMALAGGEKRSIRGA